MPSESESMVSVYNEFYRKWMEIPEVCGVGCASDHIAVMVTEKLPSETIPGEIRGIKIVQSKTGGFYAD